MSSNPHLKERLTGKYRVGPDTPNGEPEFGFRYFKAPAILGESLQEIERLERLMVYLYNQGYAAGHDDTVEGSFTDIHHDDMTTYHDDVVADLLKDS